jgi:hypothetical protein
MVPGGGSGSNSGLTGRGRNEKNKQNVIEQKVEVKK